MSYIKMNGPELNGSGKVVEQDVHVDNVKAFQASGWSVGAIEKPEADAKAKEPEKPVVSSTTPDRCGFIKKDGERCANDALQGSEFCYIKSHKP